MECQVWAGGASVEKQDEKNDKKRPSYRGTTKKNKLKQELNKKECKNKIAKVCQAKLNESEKDCEAGICEILSRKRQNSINCHRTATMHYM
jgi:hypothetical protein